MLRAECLPAFFADLRTSGFAVGPKEQEKVFAFLIHLENTRAMPQSSARLSNMLGAILCSNAEQQLEFGQRFASYFGVWGGHRPEPATNFSADETQEQGEATPEPSVWDSLSDNERRMLKRFLAVFFVVSFLMYGVPILLMMMGVIGHPGAGAARLRNFLSAPQIAWNASLDSMGPWTLFLALPLFALLAYWIAAPARPFSAFLLRRQIDHAPEMVRLLLRGAGPRPFKSAIVQRAIQQLRRPRWIESDDLAIDATLEATIRNVGLFTPIHAPRRTAPEYLILIDRRSHDDHVAAHADSLVSEFRQAMLYVDCYYFNGDPRRVARSPDALSVSLDELIARHPDHRLILITTGEGLFDPVSGARYDWTRSFSSFLTRVLLTPLPSVLWGYREEALRSDLNLSVFTFAPESIPRMAQALVGKRAFRPNPGSAAQFQPALRQLVAVLEDRPIRWIDNMAPGDSAEEELLRELNAALPSRLIRWLQASAAYPSLNYRLTQHLHRVVCNNPDDMPAAEDAAVLYSLPWFRKGHMPLWLRRRLLADTTKADIIQIKSALNKLLLSHLGRAQKTISLDAGMNRPMPPKERAILDRLDRRLHDPVMIEFLARRERDSTTIKLPRTVARMFAYGGWIHNIFSNSELEEIESAAAVLNENVKELDIETVEVDFESDEGLGIDGRRVNNILNSKQVRQVLGHECYVFLPSNAKPGSLIDDFTTSVYVRRRKTAHRLAFANIALVVGLGAANYGGEEQMAAFGTVGIAVLAAIAWILAPFWLMHRISVRPVLARMALFPRCYPDGSSPGPNGVSLKYIVASANSRDK